MSAAYEYVEGLGVVPRERPKRLRERSGIPQLLGARVAVVRVGKELAGERGLELGTLFEADSLSGDLARLEVLRRVRRECPDVPAVELMSLVEELLR